MTWKNRFFTILTTLSVVTALALARRRAPRLELA